MRALLIVLAYLLVGSGAALPADKLAELQQANTLLQSEYDLAKNGKPYLLIDLQQKQLLFKTSGVVLESWPIDGYRRWGYPAALPAVSLERKSSLDEPERNVTVVKAVEAVAEGKPKPFKAFELSDMPASYRLHLINGTVITVRPTTAGWSGMWRGALAVPAWYLSRPLISSWNFLRGSPYNELALAISAQDARMLYWAFSEGTPCLIRTPAAPAAAPAANVESIR